MLHHAESDIHPEIAIVDGNALSAMGLKSLLQSIIPKATIRVFATFCQLTDDTPDYYFHYFVSGQIFIEHSSFFLERKHKSVVLTSGVPNPAQWSGVRTLNVCQPEADVVRDLVAMYTAAHSGGRRFPKGNDNAQPVTQLLSNREIEVLVLVVKGFINKEIADKLNISLTTVISHRKNITEKLGIKSVSGLTIFAVTNGLVEANRI